MMTQLPDQELETVNHRICDPFLDRRSGEDKRQRYSLSYFNAGGTERRVYKERRVNRERRKGYVRIGPWTSVSPATSE